MKTQFFYPSGGRHEVPLNQDFFVSFGKTIVKPEEILVSVFFPFSRKVQTFCLHLNDHFK